ncbi:MAG TPA: sigma-54-dependent Fis family transcriptional regulator, partial [Myxococcaceae bacterium]|nr:sigma-54-dependent Fis family transcriptional regulator [Myxococcaceae bacterium]
MSRTEPGGFGPEDIRALRGEQSRAAFARRLGVTPLTVYRWELPEAAPQARRPRGRVAQLLRQLAEGGRPPLPPPSRALGQTPQEVQPEERTRLLTCLAHLSRAEWRAAEDGLMALMASGELRTPGARALAAMGLAYTYRWGWEDVRRAFALLLPHLPEA